MVGCKKKSAEQPANSEMPASNKDVKPTMFEQANLEAEMAAALEAEKKAKEETTKATGSRNKNSATLKESKRFAAIVADPNPPVSLQKPISLGLTKIVNIKLPEIGKSSGVPITMPSIPIPSSVGEDKKKNATTLVAANNKINAKDIKSNVKDTKRDDKNTKKDAKDAKDTELSPGKPSKLPLNMSAGDDGQSKFISPTPRHLAVSYYIKPMTLPTKK